MHSKRRLSIVVVTIALAVLGASPALGSPPEDDGGGSRIALNGTQLTGTNEPGDGRVAANGTRLTGVRDSHDRYANDDRF